MTAGHFDHCLMARTDQLGVEAALGVGILNHRLPERPEIPGIEGVASTNRRAS
jgi:hypothetical protein